MNNRVLRLEYFGGLLIDRVTFEKWELDFSTSLFLWAYYHTNNFNESNQIAALILDNNYIPVTDDVLDEVGSFVILKKHIAEKKNFVEFGRQLYKDIKASTYLSFPLEISIYPTTQCQLNCSFCFLTHKENQCSHISFEKWKPIIDEAIDNGIESISVLGGEPFLYDDLTKMTEYIISRKVKTVITTNALIFNEKIAKLSRDTDYLSIAFSIQSLNMENIDFMGVNPQIQINNIKKYIANGSKCRLNSVLLSDNIRTYTDIIEFCVENQISRYSIGFYYKKAQDLSTQNAFIHAKEMQSLLKTYLIENSLDKKIYVPIEGCMLYSAYHDEFDPKCIETPYELNTLGCECGQTKLELMYNGNVYPCIAFEGTEVYDENLFEKGLNFIWNSSTHLSLLRNYSNNHPSCNSCNMNKFCKGGCPATNYMNYGTYLDRKDDRCAVKF